MGTTESSLYHHGAPSPQDPARRHSFPSPSPSVGSSPRRSIRRARPANVVTLNGLVLGLTGSGRRTLLQRLEGKDPFVNDGSNGNKDPPRDVTIPYQPPTYATVYDRIQLHVEMKPNEEVPADFCVVLINPQHDARNLRPFIAKLVSLLIRQTAKRPLCLCFLLNFRDLQGDRCTGIQCQDVEEWVRDILQQHDFSPKVLLQCTSTSLKNCFGLGNLHHFIYQSYLAHKQVELEQRLGEVQKALVESEQQVPTMTYDAFLQVLKQATTKTVKASSEKQTEDAAVDRTVKESNEQKSKKDKQQQGETGGRQSQVNRIHHQKGSDPSRSILPKTYADPKQALDAFFADDDEEEDVVTPVTSHHARNKHVSDEDDDDDDDDFFYDEGGHRHQHGVVVMDSSSDKDDEEATVESLDSQLAHAREHSIIDSDDSDIDETAKVEISYSKPTTSDKPVKEMVKADGKAAEDELPTNSEDDIQENGVDGWGDDDDIDFSDDDNNEERTRTTVEDVKEENVKKEEADGDAEGWNDNIGDDTKQELADTAADGSKPSHADQGMSTDVEAEIDESTVEKTTSRKTMKKQSPPEEPGDSSSREADSDGGANDEPIPTKQRDSSTSRLSPSETAAEEGNSDEPELEKPVEQATETVATKVAYDDFIVENTTPPSAALSPKSHSRSQPAVQLPSSPSASPSSPSSAGISAAALAAIAAAEQEARLMMQEQNEDETSSKLEKKKTKKKKDPDAKKKKKKHKEKRREVK